jgi:hypothetical protein
MELLLRVLSEYGVAGLILLVLIYMAINGQIIFRYPRSKTRTKD